MNNTNLKRLPSIEINPSRSPVGTIIWLHGLGADGNDFVPMVSELNIPENLPLRFVFPNAPVIPVTINNGYQMRAWYDIVSMNVDQHADQKGIDASVNQLQQLIAHEKNNGIPSEKIVLAGFSQGAVIALTTGLTLTERLGGILALSGYLPHAEQITQTATANHATPIFLAHGTEDTVVPYALGKLIHSVLQKQGFAVSWHSYTMPHSVCGQEIQDIQKWLIDIYSRPL